MKIQAPIQRIFSHPNRVIVFLYLLLWSVAVIVQLSAMSFLVGDAGRSFTGVLFRTLGVFFGVLVIFFLTSRLKEKWITMSGFLIYWGAVLGLILVHFVGSDLNNAQRTIPVPIIGSIQPTEFFKIGIVFMAARIFGDYYFNTKRLGNWLFSRFSRRQKPLSFPFFLLAFLPLALTITESLSMTLFFAVLAVLLILYGGGMDRFARKMIMAGVLVGAVGLITLLLMPTSCTESGPFTRANTWKNRLKPDHCDLSDEEYARLNDAQKDSLTFVITDANRQEKYAKIAVARGLQNGFSGGGSSEMRHRLPEVYNDFVYALIIEEYGFVGLIGVPLIYILILTYVFKLARRSKSRYFEILLYGLASSIVLQALVNMFVATGVFPVTGQTLPLISYGGSSQLAISIQMGFIAAIASVIHRENLKEKKKREEYELVPQEETSEGTEGE